jgi:hypothetical protein
MLKERVSQIVDTFYYVLHLFRVFLFNGLYDISFAVNTEL